MFALIVYTLSVYALGCATFYRPKSESPKHSDIASELSNPSINKVPYGFYSAHYRLLERIAHFSGNGTPEFTYNQILLWEKSGDKRASELAKMGFLNVRVTKHGVDGKKYKVNHYSINKKGRDAVINFSHKF